MTTEGAARLGRARTLSKNHAFWLVTYTLFLLLVGATIPTPLYPIYQGRFGFSAGVLTVVFAAYMVMALFSLITFGPLSDRVGRRRVLLPALGLAAMGSVVFVFAQGVGWLLVARVLAGLGGRRYPRNRRRYPHRARTKRRPRSRRAGGGDGGGRRLGYRTTRLRCVR